MGSGNGPLRLPVTVAQRSKGNSIHMEIHMEIVRYCKQCTSKCIPEGEPQLFHIGELSLSRFVGEVSEVPHDAIVIDKRSKTVFSILGSY